MDKKLHIATVVASVDLNTLRMLKCMYASEAEYVNRWLDPKISRGQSPPAITSFHLLTRERWLSVICWIRRSPEVRALQRKQVFTYYLGSDDSLHCKPQAIASGGGAAEAARRQQATPATAAFGRRPQANAKRRAARHTTARRQPSEPARRQGKFTTNSQDKPSS